MKLLESEGAMGSDMSLPWLSVVLTPPPASRRLVLVAGGRAPDLEWLRTVRRDGDLLWAVDRGLDVCLEAGIFPDRAIGDFDSVSEKSLRRAAGHGVPLSRFPVEKDHTDLQLALKIAGEEEGPLNVLVTGCWGGRFDHNFSNLYSLAWALERGFEAAVMADEREMLLLLGGPGRLDLRTETVPEVLSLLALTPVCLGVSVSGVRWELKGEDLYLERPFAVSNRLIRDDGSCRITVEKGILGVYLNWGEAEKT